MARGLTLADLSGKMPRGLSASASCNLSGFLTLRVKNTPDREVLSGIERAIARASNRITVDLKAALDNAMRSQIWQGTEGTADIYETGELMASGRVTINQRGVTIAYDAPYAALVHYGGYVKPYGREENAKVYLPPRPWVEAVLNGYGPIQEFDFAKYYQQEIEAEFR